MKVTETTAKSILVESKLPDATYVVNPYTGCAFGCAYCYASFMGRFVDEPISAWGDYVYVKANAVELMRADLARLSPEGRKGSILLSSVTDPYQGVEAKYRLTRGILEVLAEDRYPGRVGILTKSPLVTRDIDVIGELADHEVGMTVTTTDDAVSKWLEVRAPLASKRIEALARLSKAGLNTYAFVGPLLPHFTDEPELLDQLLGAIAAAGVRNVFVEHINLKKYIRQRMDEVLVHEPAPVQERYVAARGDAHRSELSSVVLPLLEKHGLELRLGEVLYHDGRSSKQPSVAS